MFEISLKKVYAVDKIIAEKDHTSLRLPQYKLRIEMVWAKMKREVASKSKTFNLNEIQTLTAQAIDAVDREYWPKYVDHAYKMVNDYWNNEAPGFLQPPVIINLNMHNHLMTSQVL